MSAADVPASASAASSVSDTRTPAPVLRASLRLLRSELRLILGRRRNQAGLLVLASVPVLLAVALQVSEPDGGDGLLTAATSNGVFVALAALTIEIALFLPLAVAVLAGDAIAGEANQGTLRSLLTVPVSRTRLLLVKFIALLVGALLGTLVVSGTGVVVGGALLGLGPTTLLSGSQVPLIDALVRLALASLYVAAGLAALAAVGLFISALTEQPIAATVTITVVSTAMWIMDGIPQLDWLAPWLLVHRWPAFIDLMRDPVLADQMATGLLVDLGYAVVFLALAWARFSNQDVTS